MRKTWFIFIASIILFLYCTLAGAAEKGNADSPDNPGQNKQITATDSKAPGSSATKDVGKYKSFKEQARGEQIARGDSHGSNHPGYCTPEYEIFCQKACCNVSPSTPSGSNGFGQHCTPGKLKRCIACGFIPAP